MRGDAGGGGTTKGQTISAKKKFTQSPRLLIVRQNRGTGRWRAFLLKMYLYLQSERKLRNAESRRCSVN